MALDFGGEIAPASALEHSLSLPFLGSEYATDGCDKFLPLPGFASQLAPARGSEFIKAGFTIVVRSSPLGLDPTPTFNTLQGGVQGTVIDQ
jgi:hypothetical protein